LWHPQQGLWNDALRARIRQRIPWRAGSKALIAVVIAADSAVLACRAAMKWALARRTYAPDSAVRHRVLYVDCGTHRDGRELLAVHSWLASKYELRVLAFEASPDHYRAALENLRGVPELDLRQAALVGPDGTYPTARLYRSGGEGRGDSLFSRRGEAFDEVTAVRLSDVLAQEDVLGMAVILRMNIEGSEKAVVDDLVEARLLGAIDGFYGMWDDLEKIDPAAGAEFHRQLTALRVRPFTFNERDLRVGLRRWAIRTHMVASIRQGLAAPAPRPRPPTT
jgi:FkbM family methyltransferase